MQHIRTLRLLVLAAALVPSAAALAKDPSSRTVTGRGVRFSIPAGADRGRFTRNNEGQWCYCVKTNVKGLGQISVTVEPRGDPESTLLNELVGVEANARSVHMKRTRAHVVEVNRSKGGEALETAQGRRIVHLTTWSAGCQFGLALSATGGVDPMQHPVWKALVKSFRSDEPPLK